MTEDKRNAKMSEDDRADYIGRWWAMRQYAIEIGIMAERELLAEGVLDNSGRRFFNREEWRQLALK